MANAEYSPTSLVLKQGRQAKQEAITPNSSQYKMFSIKNIYIHIEKREQQSKIKIRVHLLYNARPSI